MRKKVRRRQPRTALTPSGRCCARRPAARREQSEAGQLSRRHTRKSRTGPSTRPSPCRRAWASTSSPMGSCGGTRSSTSSPSRSSGFPPTPATAATSRSRSTTRLANSSPLHHPAVGHATLRRRRMMTTEEFAYARAWARRLVKVTLLSPLMLFLVWSPQRSPDAYPDPFEMFADGLRLMKEEAEELARMGCCSIQVDAPDFGQLVDPAQRDAWEPAGISVDRVFSEGADMLNELAGVPALVRPPSVPGQLRQRLDQHRYRRDHLQAAVPAGRQLRHIPARVRRRAVGFVFRARRRPRRQDGGARPGLDEVRPDGPAGARPPGSARPAASSRWTSSRCRRSAGSPGRTGQPDQRGRPGEQAAAGGRGRGPRSG